MNKESKEKLNELSKEICQKNPKVISIVGNTDPQSAFNEFDYHLVDFGSYLLEINSSETKKVSTTKRNWIKETIKKIDPDYTIIQVVDSNKRIHYVVSELTGDPDSDSFLWEGNCSIDIGGVITFWGE